MCRNCGTPTVGRYCHICGQDLLAGRAHNLLEIINDSLGNIFAWDNKAFRTLWNLIAFPGRLTKEFYAGRIVRYVYPSKLFWFITIVFFALLFGLGNFDDSDKTKNPASTEQIEQTEQAAATEQTGQTAEAGRTERTGEAGPINVTGSIGENGRLAASVDLDDGLFKDGEVMKLLSTWAPYLVLVLVPVFGLLMWLFFRRRNYPYSDYLVFSLHFNSFVFLLFSVWVVGNAALKALFPRIELDLTGWFVIWIPAIYLAVATRRVFRPRVVPMIFKIMLLGMVYFFIMLVVLILFLIFIFVFIKRIDIFALS
jgi:hypothetical protein